MQLRKMLYLCTQFLGKPLNNNRTQIRNFKKLKYGIEMRHSGSAQCG